MDNIVLTLREKQILELVKEGLTYAEIAKRLGVSIPTVKINIRLLLARLNAKSMINAVVIAIRKGLINA